MSLPNQTPTLLPSYHPRTFPRHGIAIKLTPPSVVKTFIAPSWAQKPKGNKSA